MSDEPKKKRGRPRKDAAADRQAMRERLAEAKRLREVDKRSPEDVDLVADVLWVYENLHGSRPRKSTAPGDGALGLLDWAKKDDKNQQAFYAMVNRAFEVQERRERAAREVAEEEAQQEAEEGEAEVAEDKPLAEVERMLASMAEQANTGAPRGGEVEQSPPGLQGAGAVNGSAK